MFIKNKIEQMIEGFNEAELRQIAEYMTFLRFRSRFQPKSPFDENELARLYAEFAETDRLEANEGMNEYNTILAEEDVW